VSTPQTLCRMCKFPTMTARLISEFPGRADFSPLHSRLWKIDGRHTHRTPAHVVTQNIETEGLSTIFSADEFALVSGGLFAQRPAPNARHPRHVKATKAVEWHLSRCSGTPACLERPRSKNGKSRHRSILLVSLPSKVVSVMSTPSQHFVISSMSSAYGQFARSEHSSFFS